MDRLFVQANRLTRDVEKGFVIDNGGPTKYGITIPFLTDYWRIIGVFGTPNETDIRNLTQSIADDAYLKLIWEPLKCGSMPVGVGYALFDTAVHSGIRQASIWLQRLVGVTQDGNIGIKTLTAVRQMHPIGVVVGLCKARSAMMLSMNSTIEEKYEKGWHARLIDLTANAVLMNCGKEV